MLIGGGLVGLCGYLTLGRLADVIGRRLIASLGLLGAGIAEAIFYQTDWLLPAFGLMTLSESGLVITMNTLTTEIFSTGLRATAKAWVMNSSVLGALLGLLSSGTLSAVAAAGTVITLFGVATARLSFCFPRPARSISTRSMRRGKGAPPQVLLARH
jgi:MFS family permease